MEELRFKKKDLLIQRPSMRTSVHIVLILAIIAVTFLYLPKTIQDPDFFWHLKTGEWIWEHKSLPVDDPFSYTAGRASELKQLHYTLTSYWLSQIFYYLFYLIGGFSGTILLRFIVVGALIYAMSIRRRGDAVLYEGLLLMFVVLLLNLYSFDRPQVLSFTFFAFLLYLLERIKDESLPRKKQMLVGIFLPLLMLIWANMHGGHLIGQVTLALYIVIEGVKFVHPSLKPLRKDSYRKLFILEISGILFSFINPNTYHTLLLFMSSYGNKAFYSFITEYKSTWELFRLTNHYSFILFWLLLFLGVAGIVINNKKADLTEVLLLFGTGYFGFTQTRCLPSLICCLPQKRIFQ